MSVRPFGRALATVALTAASVLALSPQAARAAGPFSVEFGEQISTQRPLATSEPYLGLNYDIGPKTIVPI